MKITPNIKLLNHNYNYNYDGISLEEGFKKQNKKSREFSLTGGGSPQFPTYFIYDFVKP